MVIELNSHGSQSRPVSDLVGFAALWSLEMPLAESEFGLSLRCAEGTLPSTHSLGVDSLQAVGAVSAWTFVGLQEQGTFPNISAPLG